MVPKRLRRHNPKRNVCRWNLMRARVINGINAGCGVHVKTGQAPSYLGSMAAQFCFYGLAQKPNGSLRKQRHNTQRHDSIKHNNLVLKICLIVAHIPYHLGASCQQARRRCRRDPVAQRACNPNGGHRVNADDDRGANWRTPGSRHYVHAVTSVPWPTAHSKQAVDAASTSKQCAKHYCTHPQVGHIGMINMMQPRVVHPLH